MNSNASHHATHPSHELLLSDPNIFLTIHASQSILAYGTLKKATELIKEPHLSKIR